MTKSVRLRSSLLLATWALLPACGSERNSGENGVQNGPSTVTTAPSSPATSNPPTLPTSPGAPTTPAPTTPAPTTPTPTTPAATSDTNSDAVTSGDPGMGSQTSTSPATSDGAESGASDETPSGETLASGDVTAPAPSDTTGSMLPPTDDYSDFGPFETTSLANTGPDGTYTIVRPQMLGADGFLHAPITFGPGTGMQVSQMMGLLERIASHGFVIIGRALEGGPRDPVTRMRMIAGLDWIIEQNATAGSDFEGKLDVKHAVAMGYSVGGTGAVEIGGHEAIATVVSIHGHQAQGELRGPLLLMGGTEDVMSNGDSWLAPTFADSQTQTFFSLVVGADHGYIQGTHGGVPGGVETPAMIAWLRYWIYGDEAAKRYFEGDDCVMCKDPWSNPQRKNWP